MIITAKRKNTITNKQTELIFKELYRPFLQGGSYNSSMSLNLIEKYLEKCVVEYNKKTNLVTVKIGDDAKNKDNLIIFGRNFFIHHCRRLIIEQANSNVTNQELLEDFQRGMKLELIKKINEV